MQESHIKSTFPLFVRLLFGGFLAVGFLRLLNQQHQAAHPVVDGGFGQRRIKLRAKFGQRQIDILQPKPRGGGQSRGGRGAPGARIDAAGGGGGGDF